MRKASHWFLSAAIFLGISLPLSAQFYSHGASPASIRWQQARTSDLRLIYPENYQRQAMRLLHYFDTVRPRIGHGFRYGPMQIPVVIHPQNFASNGLVMWAPKRMELIAAPPVEIHAEPWLKQLSTHEYRHVVQYNNINRGVIRGLSYLFGQQASLVGLGLMPLWMLEGDAVMAETEMSSFGRGLQPSFTIEYRALSGEFGNSRQRYPMDKWFCGSFKDYIPDHYQLGYQLVTYANTRYRTNVMDEIAYNIAHRPYYLAVVFVTMKRNHQTNIRSLFRETFDDLDAFWRSQPQRQESTQPVPVPWTSYTTYKNPVPVDDTTVVVMKRDMDRYWRIVQVDIRTGAERTIRYTGPVCTPIAMRDGRLWWSEYRPGTLWEQRINAQLCYMDLSRDADGRLRGRTKVSRPDRQALFPAPMADGRVAYARYNYEGNYSIVAKGWQCDLPDTVSVHGLAWDDATQKLYFIGLSDGGMWIGALDAKTGVQQNSGFPLVKQASYSTLSELRASYGKLYYTSIQSGRDEGHLLDLATGREYRLTDSHYGSFAPLPMPDGRTAVATTYSTRGYLLSTRKLGDENRIEVTDPRPQNVVNPPRTRWQFETVESIDADSSTRSMTVKRYRKTANLFNFHSWAPGAYDPDEILGGETNPNINLGVTMLSQSLLNDMTTMLSYAHTEAGSRFLGRIGYFGLPVKFNLSATFGGGKQLVYVPRNPNPELPPSGSAPSAPYPEVPAKLKEYFETSLAAYLPLRLAGGYHLRTLIPRAELTHENSLFYNPNSIDKGVQRLSLTLLYSDNVRMSVRDFLPRWGYMLFAGYATTPFNSHFSKLWRGYAGGYLPGIARHHSLRLRSSGQYQYDGLYRFRQKDLFPRGADYNFSPRRYLSTAADYQFPVWYPDGGIRSLIYFRRVRVNLLADCARFQHTNGAMETITSYGGEVTFDVNIFRSVPAAGIGITLSLFKPSDREGVVFGANFSLPL